jgi:DNA/RNA-binding domain of Phe-tRNA-synthetase-like protein
MRESDFSIQVENHPLLRPAAFTTVFPEPLGQSVSPPWLLATLDLEANVPVQRSEELRQAVRDMLRHWGHKPAGRGKPACEYLVRAVGREELGSINMAVDACNAVSLHSGFPIALVDLDRARAPFRVAPGPQDGTYVFNASGQEMALKGLICLFDAQGPCANPVKDAQRTKTHEGTTRTLTVIWGVEGFQDRLAAALEWYREILHRMNATADLVPVTMADL